MCRCWWKGCWAGSSTPKGSGADNFISGVRRWTSREVSFIKDSLGGAEYSISLCVANKSIAIILIPNKYHEFRAWYKFVCANFIGEVYILSQTSFGHISINSSSILTVSMATESP